MSAPFALVNKYGILAVKYKCYEIYHPSDEADGRNNGKNAYDESRNVLVLHVAENAVNTADNRAEDDLDNKP